MFSLTCANCGGQVDDGRHDHGCPGPDTSIERAKAKQAECAPVPVSDSERVTPERSEEKQIITLDSLSPNVERRKSALLDAVFAYGGNHRSVKDCDAACDRVTQAIDALIHALQSSSPSIITKNDHGAELAAAPTIPDVAGCIPASSTLAAVEAANVTLSTENAQLRQALRVIRKGLSEDADGEFWPARKWLDRRDIFHGDLSGNRVLELVAKHALHGNITMPGIGYGLKHVEHFWNNGDFDGLIAFVRELLAATSPSTEVSSPTAASPALQNDSSTEQSSSQQRD